MSDTNTTTDTTDQLAEQLAAAEVEQLEAQATADVEGEPFPELTGFAIVRDETGRVLPRAADARGAKGYEIEFADGRVRAKPDRPARKAAPEQGTLF